MLRRAQPWFAAPVVLARLSKCDRNVSCMLPASLPYIAVSHNSSRLQNNKGSERHGQRSAALQALQRDRRTWRTAAYPARARIAPSRHPKKPHPFHDLPGHGPCSFVRACHRALIDRRLPYALHRMAAIVPFGSSTWHRRIPGLRIQNWPGARTAMPGGRIDSDHSFAAFGGFVGLSHFLTHIWTATLMRRKSFSGKPFLDNSIIAG